MAISAPRLRRPAAKNLGTDPLGRPIIANTIYDPNTRQVAPNGQIVTDPFPNNTIPMARFDSVSQKIQNLMPLPFCAAGPPCNASGVVNNCQNTELVKRDTEAPSLKMDQLLGSKDKLSFFWSRTMTFTATGYGEDGVASAYFVHVRRGHLCASGAPELRPHPLAHAPAAFGRGLRY